MKFDLKSLKLNYQIVLSQHRDPVRVKKVIAYLEKAKRYFSKLYAEGNSYLTDEDYDILVVGALKVLDPDNKVLDEVGSPPSEALEKAKLPMLCGSLDNLKYDDDSVDKWVSSIMQVVNCGCDDHHQPTTVASQKLDGITMLNLYKNGKLVSSFKRGDGYIGHDITPHAMVMPSVPKRLENVPPLFTTRGEAVMPEAIFQAKYKKKDENDKEGYKTARNMVAGIFNNKEPDIEKLKDVDYVTYEVKEPDSLNKTDQLYLLKTLGFKVALYEKFYSIDRDVLASCLKRMKENSIYTLDGVVIDVDADAYRKAMGFETNSIRPKYAKAFKMYDTVYSTRVISREWVVSKNGLLKPVVIFEPLDINGVTVQRAAGKTAKRIREWGIGIGSLISVIRSGDTIPDILNVIEATDPDIPTHCPACATKLEYTDEYEVDLICPNKQCPGRVYKRIIAFFRGVCVDGFNSGIASKFVKAGYDSVDKVLAMTVEDIKAIEGFQDRSATKLYNNMQKAFQTVDLATLMHATGFFGRSLGSTKLADIIDFYGAEQTLDFAHNTLEYIERKIVAIKGFEKTTADLFQRGIYLFRAWFSSNQTLFPGAFSKKEVKEVAQVSDKLANQVVLFTGFRDTDLSNKVVENGGTIVDSFSKKVTIVVAKNFDKPSDKVKKAMAAGITTVSKNDFMETYF